MTQFNNSAAGTKWHWLSNPENTEYVAREGCWAETSHRYAERGHLFTSEDGASLSIDFAGTGLVLRLGPHAVPAYGPPNLGVLTVRIDGGPERVIHPAVEPLETVLARDLPPGGHCVRVIHRASSYGSGARIEAFGVTATPAGELSFFLAGERNASLVDARAILTRDGKVIADRLVRNWLTGACRLTGLPPGKGYRLELHAVGWEPAVVEDVRIEPGQETLLPPVNLKADPATVARGWLFPRLGRQVVIRPGERFRARLQARELDIIGARLERAVGAARISRNLSFIEDEDAAFYYDREIVVSASQDTPPGLYDLIAWTRDAESGAEDVFRSPRAVMVVDKYPRDPVFVSWGHLDTQGQYQAEYLRDLVSIANLAGADMVLMANACNPAYVAGALAGLEVPCVVNFGNHQFPGCESWFGPQEGVVDYGPDLSVLNRSLAWREGISQADALLARRSGAAIKVINSFEHNAPEEFLDRHGVALLHDGHGPGARVMPMGATPTMRVGKSNSRSFRVIRFRSGRVASCTYMGDATAPFPFPRGSNPPLRTCIDPPANGKNQRITVTILNELAESFENCRLTLLMPAGVCTCEGGDIERAVESDCGRFKVLTAGANVPAGAKTVLSIHSS